MIRLLFVVFVTLGGFAVAALWHARGGDAGAVVGEIVAEGAGAAAAVRTQAERLGSDVASRLRDARTTEAPEARRADDSPGLDAVSRTAEPLAAPARPEEGEAPIDVRDLVPLEEFALDAGGSIDAPEGDLLADADGYPDDEADIEVASPEPWRDPDESAALIRRMLAVYHRTGGRR